MAVEIEHKFLVTSEHWKEAVVRCLQLKDGLISSSERRKVRVRITDETADPCHHGASQRLDCKEYEYEIPFENALALLERQCAGTMLKRADSSGRQAILSGKWMCIPGCCPASSSPRSSFRRRIPISSVRPMLGVEVTSLEEYRKINMLNA
jgi:hypothetical protein